MAGLKYKIYSLGCKVNQYDGGRLGGLLKSAGFISAEDSADVAIINTCAVTQGAIAKNRQMIKRAKKENPGAKIILAGCWPRVSSGKEMEEFGNVSVFGKESSEGIVKIIEKLFPSSRSKRTSLGSTGKACVDNFGSRTDGKERSRYFIKVQDGCEQFCSYCIIPYARGKLQSRPIAEIAVEAEAAVENGYKEIVLSGVHLGLFGINNVNKKKEEEGASLLGLLRRLAKIDGLERIRLSSIEITEVKDALIRFMADERKMCRHLHIPLQSGCDKILSAMKRPYDTRYFAARIRKIRRAMPKISLTTDVIVGFPGETEKDFLAAEGFIKKMGFSRLHVFSFSAHERTAAAKLPGRVSEAEIKDRSERLRRLSDKLAAAYRKKFIGRVLGVVVENPRAGRNIGKSEYFFDVELREKDFSALGNIKDLVGQIIKVKIKK